MTAGFIYYGWFYYTVDSVSIRDVSTWMVYTHKLDANGYVFMVPSLPLRHYSWIERTDGGVTFHEAYSLMSFEGDELEVVVPPLNNFVEDLSAVDTHAENNCDVPHIPRSDGIFNRSSLQGSFLTIQGNFRLYALDVLLTLRASLLLFSMGLTTKQIRLLPHQEKSLHFLKRSQQMLGHRASTI